MKCKICDAHSREIFETKVLLKYNVQYYECTSCKFIQTEAPYWLTEAYQTAIGDLDIGLISRNIRNQWFTSIIINSFFNTKGKFLDYGGGYGILVRLMRDNGYNFFRQDEHCSNLFAKHFDISDSGEIKFDLLTAFEVFEHLENPITEINKMLKYSDNILFSTSLQPHKTPTPTSWWYFAPEGGQHISLYSYESIVTFAKKVDMFYYNIGDMHLFTKQKVNFLSRFQFVKNYFLHRVINKLFLALFKTHKSSLQSDFHSIKSKFYTNEL